MFNRPKVVSVSDGVSQSISLRGVCREIYSGGLKRCLDIAISVVAFVVLLPLMAVIYFAIRLDGGPGLFVHRRIGMHGRGFGCLKFRTMVVEAETALTSYLVVDQAAKVEWEQTRKLKSDPRITRFGHILRKTSVDELPQLLNVLFGDMSFVGPRPVTGLELVKYADSVPKYLSVRPGITGLWQVTGRSDVSYDCRVRLDVEYCNNISFSFDIRLIIKTLVAILKCRGAY